MTILHGIDRQLVPVATGAASFTPGFGSDSPKLAIVLLTDAESDAVNNGPAQLSFGAYDGTRNVVVSSKFRDGISLSEGSAGGVGDRCARLNNPTNLNVKVACEGTSFSPNSFNVNWTDVDGVNQKLATAIMFGGSDLSAHVFESTASGATETITPGFKPDLIIVAGNHRPIGSYGSLHRMSIGAARRLGDDSIEYGCLASCWGGTDNPSLNGMKGYTDRVYTTLDDPQTGSAEGLGVTIANLTSTGFDLISDTTPTELLVISLAFNGAKTPFVSWSQTPTGTAPQAMDADEPCTDAELAFLLASRLDALATYRSDDRAAYHGVGAFSRDDGDDFSAGHGSENNVSPTNAKSRSDSRSIIIPDSALALTANASVRGVHNSTRRASGFTLDLDLTDTATSRYVLAFGFGDGEVIKPDPLVLTTTPASATANVLGYLAPSPLQLFLQQPAPTISIPLTLTPSVLALALGAPTPFTGFLLPTPLVLTLDGSSDPVVIAPVAPSVVGIDLESSYLRILQDLLPRGFAWNRKDGSNLTKLLEGMADELARVEQRGIDLVREGDPRQTVELLSEWETALGLPNPCITTARDSIVIRRAAVVSKLAREGGQSIAFFSELAKSLGYEVEIADINEVAQFQVDLSTVETPLYEDEWVFVWFVHAPEASPTFFRAGEAAAGEPLMTFENDTLTCTFDDAKPAHTKAFYLFDLPRVGYGPWETLYPDPLVLNLTATTPLLSI